MSTKARRLGAVAGIAAAVLVGAGTPAFADSEPVAGHVTRGSTELIQGSGVRTMPRTGDVKIKYTNGLGTSNSVSLRMGLINSSGDQFSQTKVLGPATGGTYTLATDVLVRTAFRLQWRPSEAVLVDTEWRGDLTWG